MGARGEPRRPISGTGTFDISAVVVQSSYVLHFALDVYTASRLSWDPPVGQHMTTTHDKS